MEYLKDPKRVNFIADEVIKYYKNKTSDGEIKSVEKRIADTEKLIVDTTTAFVEVVAMRSEMLKKSCQTKIDEYAVLLEDLKKQQNTLVFEQGLQTTKQDIVAFIQKFLRPFVTSTVAQRKRKRCSW